MKKELRPYQIEAIETVNRKLSDGVTRQLLVLATGLGKTFVASTIANQYKKVLWITHTEELILQSAKSLMSFNPSVGIIKAERFDIDKEIVVASIQTLWRRLDKIDKDTFEIIIVDEAHMAASRTWSMAIEHFDVKLLLGLTATPHRSDGMPLGDVFDEIVFEKDILWGIQNGFLCELNAVKVQTDISLDNVRTTAGELNSKDLTLVNNPVRNKLIVDKYEEYCNGVPALIFCVDVEHAIELNKVFANKGHKSTFVVGDEKLCPDRADRLKAFTTNEIQIVTNVMVLTAGFDYPDVQCIIMARPTKSLTVYLQAIGRGTRLKSNGAGCIILDVVDISKKHKLVNTWSLDENKPIDEKVFITKEEKEKLLDEERVARETKIENSVKKDEVIQLFKIPKVTINTTSYRMREPATEAQLKWIASLGYDIVNVPYTKAMCNAIISALPATDKQVWALKQMGYDTNKPISNAEAQACFAEHNKRLAEKVKGTVFNEL